LRKEPLQSWTPRFQRRGRTRCQRRRRTRRWWQKKVFW